MARLTDPIHRDDDLESLEIRQTSSDQRDAALALLLTGSTERNRQSTSAIQTFLDFAGEHRLDLTQFWTIGRSDQLRAAVLIVPSAGRTAIGFISPLLNLADMAAAQRLLIHVRRAQDCEQIRLIQMLLEPIQVLEAQTLRDAGFQTLAQLVYMQRRIDEVGRPLQLNADQQLIHWSQVNRPLFAQTILASYEDTQDCPGLLGLRSIDDILDGHQAAGVFDPAMWSVLCEGGEPIAVMLLANLPQRQAVELVYLGVVKSCRKRGLAGRLLNHALAQARQRQACWLMLAVDEHNVAAMTLYKQRRFQTTARKTAMILPLSAESQTQSRGAVG